MTFPSPAEVTAMPLSLQQIFDKALFGIREQGRLSGILSGGLTSVCNYRMCVDGATLKCVVGQLIPDNVYDPTFDTDAITGAATLIDCSPDFVAALRAGGVDANDNDVEDLLIRLQDAHDDAVWSQSPMGTFEINMKALAHHVGLTYREPA